jgi:hypothetical protein
MPDSLALAIVDEALATHQARPELTALQVLDLVMRGRRGTAPDFGALAAGDSLLDPSSPFGALLAAAFDEQITFSGVRTLADRAPQRPNAFEEFWVERVRRAFAARYGLHGLG